MLGGSWKVGSIAGIPIRVNPTWLLIVALWVYNLGGYFQFKFPQLTSNRDLALAGLAAFIFFASILFHELAHAGAARAYGLPVEGITLVFWGGFTQIRRDVRRPGVDFLISAAGPGTSLLYGAIVFGISRVVGGGRPELSAALGYVGLLSMALGALNAIPGWPILDGGNMFRAAAWKVTGEEEKADRLAGPVGIGTGVALIASAVWLMSQRSEVSGYGLWLIIVGALVAQAARGQMRRGQLVAALGRGTAELAMGPPPATIPSDMTLSEALDRFFRGHETEAFPVIQDERVIGMVSFNSSRELGSRDPMRPVREALIPLERVLVVQASEPLDQVVQHLGPGGVGLVLRDGALAGAIGQADITRWAAAHAGR